MQALASYEQQLHPVIQAVLNELEDPLEGLVARPQFLNAGSYAKFMWADWPEDRSASLTEKIKGFFREHPELQRLDNRCEEWGAVFGGETDGEAAAEIGKRLQSHFPDRVHWVVAERNARGKVLAWSLIEGLGEILWHLSWRHVGAEPAVSAEPAVAHISGDDMRNLNGAIFEVYSWARARIQPILETLHEKLGSLYGDRFRGLYVFGSYARPDAGIRLPDSSDLDVALILSDFDNTYDERARFGDIVYDLSLEHSLAISVVPIREADFKEGQTNFTRVISEYAIPVT